MTEGCGAIIKSSFLVPEHTCKRSLWKDGYCKVHHPESYKKRKRKTMNNAWTERIKELEAENKRLREALEEILAYDLHPVSNNIAEEALK